jgi:hypothetical protein
LIGAVWLLFLLRYIEERSLYNKKLLFALEYEEGVEDKEAIRR